MPTIPPEVPDLTAIFKAAWAEVQQHMEPDELPRDEVWFWWPTIVNSEPNWEALSDNLGTFGMNPYIAMLTVYYYGFAHALDGMMSEKLYPEHQAGARRLPQWLEETVLEDVAKRYADRH